MGNSSARPSNNNNNNNNISHNIHNINRNRSYNSNLAFNNPGVNNPGVNHNRDIPNNVNTNINNNNSNNNNNNNSDAELIEGGYDAVINIDDLTSVVTGWKVEAIGGIQANMWNGYVIGITGIFNRGKSFVLSQLTGAKFNVGNDWHTKGLSVKFFTSTVTPSTTVNPTTMRHVVIDTSGLNSPLSLVSTEQTTEVSPDGDTEASDTVKKLSEQQKKRLIHADTTEQFLTSLTLQLSDYIIVVVGDLTRQDQEFISRVTEQRKAKVGVFVVHNLKTVRRKEELVKIWESTCKLYPGEHKHEDDGTSWFFYQDDNLEQRHVCLADHNTEFGEAHNRRVFALLNKWLDAIVHKLSRNLKHPLDPVVESCNRIMKNYLKGVGNIHMEKLEDESVVLKASANLNEELIVKGDHDKLTQLQMRSYQPEYQISQLDDPACAGSKFCQVTIDAPDLVEVEVRPVTAERPGFSKFAIEGEKRKPPEPYDFCNRLYGKFCIFIDVPSMYHPNPTIDHHYDGRTTVVWKQLMQQTSTKSTPTSPPPPKAN